MKLFENFLRETRQKRFWRQLRHFFVFLPYGRILKETGRLGACSLIMWVSLHLFRTPEHYDAVLVQKFVMISGLFCILIYPLYLSPNTYPSLLYGSTAYIAVLSAIGIFGDKLIDTPNPAISVLFVIALTQFILTCSKTGISYCNPLRHDHGNYSYGTPVTTRLRFRTGYLSPHMKRVMRWYTLLLMSTHQIFWSWLRLKRIIRAHWVMYRMA